MSTPSITSSDVTRRPALTHVVVVDDDPTARKALEQYLGNHWIRVTSVADGEAMLARIADDVVDLVVLAVDLERSDGMSLARRLRDESTIPIIMLTSPCDVVDRVLGLELGADDLVTKPCNPRELVARIRAVLRRRSHTYQGRITSARAYRFDDWELNLNTRRLTNRDGRRAVLSRREFSLLVVFLGAPGRILSRDQLLDMSRLHGDDVYNRAVDTQVCRLRRKIEIDPARPRYIRTERGAGYIFGAPVETVY